MEEGEGNETQAPQGWVGARRGERPLFCYLHGLVWVCSRVLFSLYPLLTSPHPSWAPKR